MDAGFFDENGDQAFNPTQYEALFSFAIRKIPAAPSLLTMNSSGSRR